MNFKDVKHTDELRIWKAPKHDRWLQLRKQFITSTEMAPASGINKYGNTKFSIYHVKRDELDDSFEPSDRVTAGKLLEPAIAKIVAEKIGRKVRRLPHFMARGAMGASFDYEIEDEDGNFTENSWLLEIKNVDGFIFRDDWNDGSDGWTAPDHIEIQAQSQLEVARRPGVLIAPLVGGNDLKEQWVRRDPDFGAALQTNATALWKDIVDGNRPDPEGDDAAHVVNLFNTAKEGSAIEADADIDEKLQRHRALKLEIDKMEEEQDQIKAEVLLVIEDTARVIGSNGITLDAGQTKHTPPSIITANMVGNKIGGRKGFRRFTIRQKKGAK